MFSHRGTPHTNMTRTRLGSDRDVISDLDTLRGPRRNVPLGPIEPFLMLENFAWVLGHNRPKRSNFRVSHTELSVSMHVQAIDSDDTCCP